MSSFKIFDIAGSGMSAQSVRLNTVASNLASGVNAVHGTPPFFTGTTASTLTVNVSISTLKAGTSGTAGDTSIARAVGALRNGTIDAGYSSFVRQVAFDASEANRAQQLAIRANAPRPNDRTGPGEHDTLLKSKR